MQLYNYLFFLLYKLVYITVTCEAKLCNVQKISL